MITMKHKKTAIKHQVLATLLSLASAVMLPEFFHILGIAAGVDSTLGELLLPMHLPIILTGLLSGPYSAAIAGALSPIISYAVTGMPNESLLPFMVIELFCYGLFSGLLKNTKLSSTVKVIAVQMIGRIVRAITILISVYATDYNGISVSIIWTSITKGLLGIVFQIILIPLILYRLDNMSNVK